MRYTSQRFRATWIVGVMPIRDLVQLEQLKQRIDDAQKLLIVAMPKRRFFDFKSFEPKLQEACAHNNTIYSSQLPEEVEVSSEIS